MTKDVCQRLNIWMLIFRGDMSSIAVPLDCWLFLPGEAPTVVTSRSLKFLA